MWLYCIEYKRIARKLLAVFIVFAILNLFGFSLFTIDFPASVMNNPHEPDHQGKEGRIGDGLDRPQQEPETLAGEAEELWIRFWDTADTDLLTKIIDLHHRALQLSPTGHPYRPRALLKLAVSLVARARVSSDPDNMATINEVVRMGREALSLWPADDCERDGPLILLAEALRSQFLVTESANAETALEAISLYREALPYFPIGSSPYRETILDRFARALKASWKGMSNINDLPEAFSIQRELLSYHSNDGPERVEILWGLLVICGSYPVQTADLAILDEYIYACRELQRLLPDSHNFHQIAKMGCSTALMMRYKLSGNLENLEEATMLQRAALAMLPPTSLDHLDWENELANAHLSLFISTGDADKLAQAIASFRSILGARLAGDPHRGEALDNLASALRIRFQQTGDLGYLIEGNKLHEQAIILHPPGHPARQVSLNSLANGLMMLHQHQSTPSSLDRILALRRECLSLTPPGQPERGAAVSSLAATLSAIYHRDGDISAISESIPLHREALLLHPIGHPSRSASVGVFIDALILRHAEFHSDEDIDEALALVLDEILNMPDSHPNRFLFHSTAADLFLTKSARYSWEGALHHILLSAKDSAVPARRRLDWLQKSIKHIEFSDWITTTEEKQSRQLLELYLELISLLPRVAHFGLDATSRLREVGLIDEWVYRLAAMRAIYMSEYATAVEILEESKSVFWEQALRLRAPLLDQLPADEKRELKALLHRLEQDNTSGIHDQMVLEAEVEERRHTNARLERIIDDIRARPGFGRFLKTPLYEDLTVAAAAGPVVLLFPALDNCLAIFIQNVGGSPVCGKLEIITASKLRELRIQLPHSGLRDQNQATAGYSEERAIRVAPATKRALGPYAILKTIWSLIVGPLISALDIPKSKGRDRPRVHWIPFGDFSYLPLHAAGVYEGQDLICAADYVVSSYSPSLSALIKSRQNFSHTGIPREQLKALLVGEANAPLLTPLESIEEEINVVASIALSASVSVVNDIDAVALTKNILNDLPSVHILHLACHGCQNRSAPLQSHFALRDGRLDVSTLMKLDLRNATFAFLSACETAKGDPTKPDQAVHLAASMLFCGFRSIIATMWTMGDIDGPVVAQKVYEELFSLEQLGLDDIPYALDAAVQQLRERGASPGQWATFVHIGA